MQSRVERFKAYREQIAQNVNEEGVERLVVTEEVINQQNEDTVKRNTLTMSIDQIIEANDEYTSNIRQKRLLEEEKRKKQRTAIKCLIAILIILLIVVIVVSILWGK